MHQVTERLADDDNEAVRAAAAEALGWIGGPPAVPQLIRSFEDDPDDDVRSRAAGALGSLGDPAAIPALEAAARAHLPISSEGCTGNPSSKRSAPSAGSCPTPQPSPPSMRWS